MKIYLCYLLKKIYSDCWCFVRLVRLNSMALHLSNSYFHLERCSRYFSNSISSYLSADSQSVYFSFLFPLLCIRRLEGFQISHRLKSYCFRLSKWEDFRVFSFSWFLRYFKGGYSIMTFEKRVLSGEILS